MNVQILKMKPLGLPSYKKLKIYEKNTIALYCKVSITTKVISPNTHKIVIYNKYNILNGSVRSLSINDRMFTYGMACLFHAFSGLSTSHSP